MCKSMLTIAVTSVACLATTNVHSQSAQPSSMHSTPQAAQQGGTHLDGTVTPGPNIGMESTSLPPTTPGTGRFEGAQPGQSGSAQAIQQGMPSPLGGPGRQSVGVEQPLNRFESQSLQLNRTADSSNATPTGQVPQGTAIAPVDRFGPTSVGTPTPRRLALDAQRDRILNDLRAHGHIVESWRVLPHDGYWWYYTPDSTWMMLDDANAWIAYRAAIEPRPPRAVHSSNEVVTFPTGYPRDRWRMVFHDGRWWFWTPEETWLYQDQGRWVALRQSRSTVATAKSPTPHRVGFRDVIEPLNLGVDGTASPAVPLNTLPVEAQQETLPSVP